jgi:hypothetical protein
MTAEKRWGVSFVLLAAYGCTGQSTLGSGMDNQPSKAGQSDAAAPRKADTVASSDEPKTETELNVEEHEPAMTADSKPRSEEQTAEETTEEPALAARVDGGGNSMSPTEAAPNNEPATNDLPGHEPTTEAPDSGTPASDTIAEATASTELSTGEADAGSEAVDPEQQICMPENAEVVSIAEVMPDKSNWYTGEDCTLRDAEVAAPEEVVNLEVEVLAGTWRDGEGDERIELVLDATGHGSLLYGEPGELPLVDPAAAYLVDEMKAEAEYQRLGFTYELHPVDGGGSEMTAQVRLTEPWAEWCSLQTPKPGATCYACEVDYNMGYRFFYNECGTSGCFIPTTPAATQLAQVDCGRTNLCLSFSRVCECNSTFCKASRTSRDLTFALDPVDSNVLRVPNGWNDPTTRYLARSE